MALSHAYIMRPIPGYGMNIYTEGGTLGMPLSSTDSTISNTGSPLSYKSGTHPYHNFPGGITIGPFGGYGTYWVNDGNLGGLGTFNHDDFGYEDHTEQGSRISYFHIVMEDGWEASIEDFYDRTAEVYQEWLDAGQPGAYRTDPALWFNHVEFYQPPYGDPTIDESAIVAGFQNTAFTGEVVEATLYPEGEDIVRINTMTVCRLYVWMKPDYHPTPGDLFVFSVGNDNPQYVGRSAGPRSATPSLSFTEPTEKTVTVNVVEDITGIANSLVPNSSYPATISIEPKEGVKYLNRYNTDDLNLGHTLSGLPNPNELDVSTAKNNNVAASVELWHNHGSNVENPSTSIGSSSATDYGHYFRFNCSNDISKAFATVTVSMSQDHPDTSSFNGFKKSDIYNSKESNQFASKGFFHFERDTHEILKHPNASANINKFNKDVSIYDEKYRTYVKPNGSRGKELVSFKFDLYFTERAIGTNLNKNINKYSVLHSYLGRDRDVVFPSEGGDEITLARQYKPYGIPATKVYSNDNGEHVQFPWIQPDYTMVLDVKMNSGCELVNSNSTTTSDLIGVSSTSKTITNFITNLSKLRNNSSEMIIPSSGVSKNDRLTCRVIGDPGAKFSIKLIEKKTVEIVGGASRSSGSSSPSAIQLDGGVIPEMPTGEVTISRSGKYDFIFPDVEALSGSLTGWKEFEFVIRPSVGTVLTTSSAIKPNTSIVDNSNNKTSNPVIGRLLKRKLYQLPNVSIEFTAESLPGGWSYMSNYNVSDIPIIGKPKTIRGGIPLSKLDKRKNTIAFTIIVHKSSSTFSLNTSYLTPIYSSQDSSVVSSYQIPKECFVPSLETRLDVNTPVTDLDPSKENLDQVDVVAFARIGRSFGSTDNDYATIHGTITAARHGLRPQTYTMDISKIFNNA